MKKLIEAILLMLIRITILYFVWPETAVALFHLPALDFKHAFLLLLLSNALFHHSVTIVKPEEE